MSFDLKILFFILKTLNSVIPKSKNRILFISRPDFADNTKHMYDYFAKNNSDKKELLWLIYDKHAYDILIGKGLKNIYYLKSLSGMYVYVRSKYIVTSSSSLWQIKSPFQKQFDLWHGIPLKTILCMGEIGISSERQAGNITMRFATSNLTKALLAASFDFNATKIQITGQARTDCLFKNDRVLYEFLDIDPEEYDQIVLYMPTYRSGYKNKNDGTEIISNNVFRFSQYGHEEFIDFLKKHRILFLFKLHPYEEKLYGDVIAGENIKIISYKSLIRKQLDIHELLSDIDILITDYSSVYFDYLLLDKKIIFVPTDRDIYESKRGFNLEPYDFWTPGEKVYTQSELEKVIISKDEYKSERKTICDIIHDYQEGESCRRVYDKIKQYL